MDRSGPRRTHRAGPGRRLRSLALVLAAVAALVTPIVYAAGQTSAETTMSATFTWSPTQPQAGQLIRFNATVSGGKSPYRYSWTFGDGTNGTGKKPTHVYWNAGAFAVNLTVRSGNGLKAHAHRVVGVAPPSGVFRVGTPVGTASPSFFGVNLNVHAPTALLTDPALGEFLNATPIDTFKVTAGAEACNQTTNTFWTRNGTVAPNGCPLNDSAYAGWFDSRTADGASTFQVPAEINSSVVAQETVAYVEDGLGMHPAFWDIGEAPQDWGHVNISWPDWRWTDNARDSALTHALLTNKLANAIHAVDPGARLIVPIATPGGLAGLADMARIVGTNVTGYSMYLYPDGLGWTGADLADYYAGLNRPANGTYRGNISDALASWRTTIAQNCVACESDPILLEEYAPSHNDSVWCSTYNEEYPSAVAMAASVTQALKANVSVFSYQTLDAPGGTLQSLDLIDKNNTVRPVGVLYRDVLSRLATGTVYDSTVASPMGTQIFAVETFDGNRHSLLVASTNLTQPVTVDFQQAFAIGTAGRVVGWQPGAPAPSVAATLLQADYTVPPQGILEISW